MYLYTIATVTVHICTVTVTRVFDFFFLSLASDSHLNSLSHFITALSFSHLNSYHSSLFLLSQLYTAKSISLSDHLNLLLNSSEA